MLIKFNLLLLMCMLGCIAYGQSLNVFLEHFRKDTLPICIDYSYEEQVSFGAIFHVDSSYIVEEDTIYVEYEDIYEENEYKRDTSTLLTEECVKKYLLPNLDDSLLAIYNEHLEGEFYGINIIIETKKFYGVIYEQLVERGSKKYFCTFNNHGEFISRILIASFVLQGSGYCKFRSILTQQFRSS